MKVFVDDSGSPDFFTPYSVEFVKNPPEFKNYEDFWRKNYFVLAGVCIDNKNLGQVNKEINAIKKEFFGTSSVEIKSDWMRNPNQRKKRYIDTYNITPEKLNEFGETILDYIKNKSSIIRIIAVVFDKRCYGENLRGQADGKPILKSSQILFERIQYLNKPGTIVSFDQMESSLKLTKGKNGQILRVLQNRLELQKIFVSEYTNISKIDFKESKSENFLQIADLSAYNIYRQFIEFGRTINGKEIDFAKDYKYFEMIKGNLINKNGKIRGVGLVILPDINRKTPHK